MLGRQIYDFEFPRSDTGGSDMTRTSGIVLGGRSGFSAGVCAATRAPS